MKIKSLQKIFLVTFTFLLFVSFMLPTKTVNAVSAQAVSFYLPYNANSGNVKSWRTGRIYEADYKAAGLTYMISGDYHPAASWAKPTYMRGAIDFNLYYQPVYASAAGVVSEVANCHIYIDHGNGIKSFYEHLSSKLVKVGDKVYPWTKIGVSGNSCGSTGPHLHFAVFSYGYEMKVKFNDASAQRTGGIVRPSHVDTNPTYYYKADLKPTPPLPTVFAGGYSVLSQDQNWGRANLKVCASNLTNQTVYVRFFRSGRVWEYSKKATSTCVIFWDLDGFGPLNRYTTYYSQAALNQKPNPTWPIPCAVASGGKGLCDRITRY